MKPVPTLLIAGAAVLLIGSAFYFQNSEKPIATASSNSPSDKMAVDAPKAQLAAPESIAANPVNTESKNPNAEILQRPDPNPNYVTFKDRVYEVEARRNGRSVDPAELWAAAQQPNAWKALPKAPDSLNLSETDKNDGRKFIELSPLKLESLVAGDTLEIDTGEAGKSFKVKIDHAQSDDDGKNVTWTGDSIDSDSHNHITITKGDSLVVGGISTPEGLFELEVHDGKGWIVSNATLFRKGTDQHITVPQDLIKNPPQDAVILPIDPVSKKH